jgi:hypothetical protein
MKGEWAQAISLDALDEAAEKNGTAFHKALRGNG